MRADVDTPLEFLVALLAQHLLGRLPEQTLVCSVDHHDVEIAGDQIHSWLVVDARVHEAGC
jgi:hypothetical protein